ncbi:MAG: tetratricopeptide repeat protein [Deltaproteobacteria bacterium]|nr:tetratricopeptide repeat protein [Deltaproteobacteria bacterium]
MSLPGRRVAHLALSALLLAACAKPKEVADVASLTYTEDARDAYLEAMEAFRAQTWEEARLQFQEVKRVYGFSAYARLSEVRLADIEFEQGKYSEALSAYRAFVRAHRSDENVDYARYRIAKGSYLEVSDTPLLPPAEERDQGTTEDAYRELKAYVERYPDSRYMVDAKYMLDVVTQRLVRHELFVARYYLNVDNFEAALRRIERSLVKYAGSGLDAEALVLQGETLLKKHDPDKARAAFEKVVAEHPGPFVEVAQRFLASMNARKAGGG